MFVNQEEILTEAAASSPRALRDALQWFAEGGPSSGVVPNFAACAAADARLEEIESRHGRRGWRQREIVWSNAFEAAGGDSGPVRRLAS